MLGLVQIRNNLLSSSSCIEATSTLTRVTSRSIVDFILIYASVMQNDMSSLCIAFSQHLAVISGSQKANPTRVESAMAGRSAGLQVPEGLLRLLGEGKSAGEPQHKKDTWCFENPSSPPASSISLPPTYQKLQRERESQRNYVACPVSNSTLRAETGTKPIPSNEVS